jgi:hypothetical protein
MDNKEFLQELITNFITTVEKNDGTSLEALGVLAFLTGLYQQMSIDIMEKLAEGIDKDS